MAALQAEIGEQAAEVHRNHKFNSGATEPTGESSPTKLASGLLGTAEVCTHASCSLGSVACYLFKQECMCVCTWLALYNCVFGLGAFLCWLAPESTLVC